MNKEYHVTVFIEEKTEYSLDQTLAKSFEGIDIKNQMKTKNLESVIGTVDDCWYNGDIVAKVTIYKEEAIEKIDRGIVDICPTVIRNIDNTDHVEGINMFLSANASEEVGEVEPVK